MPEPLTSVVRLPASRLGVVVVDELVTSITTGRFVAGSPLPPEAVLSKTFGVSRTIIRESIKRIEEKGLVSVEHGRGTIVRPASSWNVLDPIVLSALVENDDTLGILDDLAVVRGSLEGAMAALTASGRDDGQLGELADALGRMRDSLADEVAFNQADADFHLAVMAASRNTLADSITRILFQRARDNHRFQGASSLEDLRTTLDEHQQVFEAIVRKDPERAESVMKSHIRDAWSRRRPRRV